MNCQKHRPRMFNRALNIVAASLLLTCAACDDDEAASPGAAITNQARTDTAPNSETIPAVQLVLAFPKLTFQRPVFITQAPAGSDPGKRMFVVEQPGRILTFENRNDVSETQVFLDIRSRVRSQHNEEGLLSLVFHPKFSENGQFFVYYSVSSPKRNRIARYVATRDDAGRQIHADPDSEHVILEVQQKYGNHNGSTLLFGPDGFLYASFGDGGLANDPDLHGQNLGTLLGSIIRIDVDREESGKAYAIPPDNPFVNRPDARPEIWAYGLRNVWRMSFDRNTGELWAGDVGQDAWEEIDLITKGGNFGWNRREGKHDFASGVRRLAARLPADPLIDPVIDYSHREGISVTGGYVYRGQKHERLQGVYIYADYGSRAIWGLRHENGKVTAHRKLAGGAESAFITSFGEDAEGELYACAFNQLDGRPGRIYRIAAQ